MTTEGRLDVRAALIRAIGGEVLPHQAVGHWLIVPAVRSALVALAHEGLKALIRPQADDTLATDVLAPLDEVVMEARAPLVAAAARERCMQQDLEAAVHCACFDSGRVGIRRIRSATPRRQSVRTGACPLRGEI